MVNVPPVGYHVNVAAITALNTFAVVLDEVESTHADPYAFVGNAGFVITSDE